MKTIMLLAVLCCSCLALADTDLACWTNTAYSPAHHCNGEPCDVLGSGCCTGGNCFCQNAAFEPGYAGENQCCQPNTHTAGALGCSSDADCCEGDQCGGGPEKLCCASTERTGPDGNGHGVPCDHNDSYCCENYYEPSPGQGQATCVDNRCCFADGQYNTYNDNNSCCSKDLHAHYCGCAPVTDQDNCTGSYDKCACTADADCCTGHCLSGFCCKASGTSAACDAGADCCSNMCVSGACCGGIGVTCTAPSQCCSGLCSAGHCLCTAVGGACFNSSTCCSGHTCVAGHCA
jgi:hypothetical protein